VLSKLPLRTIIVELFRAMTVPKFDALAAEIAERVRAS